MSIVLNDKEMALLIGLMKSCRKNVKKGFKKVYSDWYDKVKAYDSVISSLVEVAKKEEDGREVFIVDLDNDQRVMLNSFVTWFINELQVINVKERKEDISILQSINEKIAA